MHCAGIINRAGRRKFYEDTRKPNLKLLGINTEIWHELGENSSFWRRAVKRENNYMRSIEKEREKDKRHKCKRGTRQNL